MVNNNIRCVCIKPDGKRCKNKKNAGNELCTIHTAIELVPPFKLDDFDHDMMQQENEQDATLHGDDLSAMIASLTAQFEDKCKVLREKITVLESERKDVEPRKPRRRNVQDFSKQAKLKFYHEKKDSCEVRRVLREKLVSVGLYHNDDRIPWTLVKQWTDQMFDELLDVEKGMYVEMAKHTYNQKHMV